MIRRLSTHFARATRSRFYAQLTDHVVTEADSENLKAVAEDGPEGVIDVEAWEAFCGPSRANIDPSYDPAEQAIKASFSDVYAKWLEKYEGTTPFTPRAEGSDYNQHNELVDSTPEMDAELTRMYQEAGLLD